MNDIKIIRFEREHAEAVSRIIIDNLIYVNSKEYELSVMEEMATRFTKEDVIANNCDRFAFVALIDDKVVGTGSVTNSFSEVKSEFWVLTVFVDYKKHGFDIGKTMMVFLEDFARGLNATKLILPASLTAHGFYVKLGFEYQDGFEKSNDKDQYMMEKKLTD